MLKGNYTSIIEGKFVSYSYIKTEHTMFTQSMMNYRNTNLSEWNQTKKNKTKTYYDSNFLLFKTRRGGKLMS